MATHHYRFGPLQILDSDWRRNTWKNWLRSRLAVSEAQPPAAASRPTTMAPPPPEQRGPDNREVEARRSDVRARFDALFDRLLSVEDSLDALTKRFALKLVHERRQEQRLFERVESTAEALERQALALESACSALERIEQRVERMERGLRSAGGIAHGNFESQRPSTRSDTDDLAEIEDAFATYASRLRSSAPEAYDNFDVGAHAGTSIRGSLSEMSLATVLAMLELERRTGVLKVCSDDGSVVTATLRNGTIVGSRSQELDIDPVEGIREALRFASGHFAFRQSSVEVASGPPRSVGSILLEATSRNDEAAKAS